MEQLQFPELGIHVGSDQPYRGNRSGRRVRSKG